MKDTHKIMLEIGFWASQTNLPALCSTLLLVDSLNLLIDLFIYLLILIVIWGIVKMELIFVRLALW